MSKLPKIADQWGKTGVLMEVVNKILKNQNQSAAKFVHLICTILKH